MYSNSIFDWRKRPINHFSVHTMNYSSFSLPDTTNKKEMGSMYDIYSSNLVDNQNLSDKMDIANDQQSWFLKSAARACTNILRKLWRASSPDLSFYDCEPRASSPSSWPSAKTENKNIELLDTGFSSSEMNGDCKSVVAACEDKLNKVRQLITTKTVSSSPKCSTYRSRRPRRRFVEANSVEESFEDAFSPEDFVSHPDNKQIAFLIPYQYESGFFCEIDGAKMKTERDKTTIASKDKEHLNLKPEIPPNNIQDTTIVKDIADNTKVETNKAQETVASCEQKMLKLHALLQERKKSKTALNLDDSVAESVKERPKRIKSKGIPVKAQDKRFKNPNRSPEKRKNVSTKKNIQDDMLFADELTEDMSSVENSPRLVNLAKLCDHLPVPKENDYFDEISGRFRSASGTESDDSFQVVFADSPHQSYRPSECDSEDSFIFFEDSPDSCYTSNDVFGNGSDSESEYSDSDTEVSDSGCDSDELKMSHSMSKTVEDLTDDALYKGEDIRKSETVDQVDCAVRICEEIPSQDLVSEVSEAKSASLLLNDEKKLLRKSQPSKKVSFSVFLFIYSQLQNYVNILELSNHY